MRNLDLEAAIWSLFTSADFFEAASRECGNTMKWFGDLAVSKNLPNFGRNNQIYDKFKTFARNFGRGAELARLDDYKVIWDTAGSVSGNIRGMMEQPLHSWMSASEYSEFTNIRISRLLTCAGIIENALTNAMMGVGNLENSHMDCMERIDDDDGFPGDDIVGWYEDFSARNKDASYPTVPDPLPEYKVNQLVACRTGEEVPCTGVWYPNTGLEHHSLTFAIKGAKMQPVFRVTKTREELKAEGVTLPYPETVAVDTVWHPLIPSARQLSIAHELWAKAGQPCPKAGMWQPTDPGAAQRIYQEGEPMLDLKSAYGFTVWRWVADR